MKTLDKSLFGLICGMFSFCLQMSKSLAGQINTSWSNGSVSLPTGGVHLFVLSLRFHVHFSVWLERDSDCKTMLLNSGTGFLLPSYTMSTTSFLEPTREHSVSPLPGSGTVKRLGSRASTRRRLFVGFSFDSSLLWGNEQISTQSEAGFCKEFLRCWWFPSWNGWGLLFYQGHGDYSRPTLGILWLQQLEVHILLCNLKKRRLTPFLHPYRQRSARAALAPSDMQLFRRHVFHVHRDIGIKIILLYIYIYVFFCFFFHIDSMDVITCRCRMCRYRY